jgi:hypothetical protein
MELPCIRCMAVCKCTRMCMHGQRRGAVHGRVHMHSERHVELRAVQLPPCAPTMHGNRMADAQTPRPAWQRMHTCSACIKPFPHTSLPLPRPCNSHVARMGRCNCAPHAALGSAFWQGPMRYMRLMQGAQHWLFAAQVSSCASSPTNSCSEMSPTVVS